MEILVEDHEDEACGRFAQATINIGRDQVSFCILPSSLREAMARGGTAAGIQLLREEAALAAEWRRAGETLAVPPVEGEPPPPAGLSERQRRSGEVIAERREGWPRGGWPAASLRRVRR